MSKPKELYTPVSGKIKDDTHLSELTLLTPNKVRLTTTKERKMADQTTRERGERNWKIHRRCSGLRTTTVVPLVMKGLVKSTTIDRLADIWKGARATSAFWRKRNRNDCWVDSSKEA